MTDTLDTTQGDEDGEQAGERHDMTHVTETACDADLSTIMERASHREPFRALVTVEDALRWWARRQRI